MFQNRRILLLGLCCGVGAALAYASAFFIRVESHDVTANWLPLVSEEYGFAARFPTPWTHSIEPVMSSERTLAQWSTWSEGIRFAIVVSPLPTPRVNTNDEIFDFAIEMTKQQFAGTIEVNEPIELQGQPGRHSIIVTNVGTVESNVYAVGNRLYHIQTVFTSETENPVIVTAFQSQFAINRE